MHSLKPITALGGSEPRIDTFGALAIAEVDTLSLASVAMRQKGKTATHRVVKSLLGSVPGPGQTAAKGDYSGLWMGPDQWMIAAPMDSHEDLADQLVAKLGQAASVTEQSGAWAAFDLTGESMFDACERLCAAPIRKMAVGDAQRSTVHQLGCFVIKQDASIRILGPRASTGSLHHALIDAAKSVT